MTINAHSPFAEPPQFTTPVFDETTLPAKLQEQHSTKAGQWGLIRVLEGQIRYIVVESGEQMILDPSNPGIILPEQVHHVTLIGPVRLHVEFYNSPPSS